MFKMYDGKIKASDIYQLLVDNGLIISVFHQWVHNQKSFARFGGYFTARNKFRDYSEHSRRSFHNYWLTEKQAKTILRSYGLEYQQEEPYSEDLPFDVEEPEVIAPPPSVCAVAPVADVPDIDYKQLYDELLVRSEKALVFMNAVQASDDCINVKTMATILMQDGINFNERRFFQWLRDNGYLFDEDYFKNIPTEKAINQGVMTVREVTVNGSGSKPHISFTPKITGQGQIYFVNYFNALKGNNNGED